ncbi:MAG: FlgD immunoglobulin-like domain containing protein [Chloroflexota bacterium]
MRRTVAALVLVMLASLGALVPSVSAAVGDPKVVIIVGATHGATAGYRADGDVAYAEARKYTSNVVKVYSPNATWSAVKAAVVGASIVIYMGHGNGWPSPYTYDPLFTTKDGFGLNATAGAGDYNNKYYGEPYVASLDLAPGAIVLLHHLCYAAGNSEPGNPEPSVSVARQRADNYAAGFLKAGASAVIADGHAGAESYIRALFTTHQSIESMWRSMPNRNNHFVSFASSRTTGATVYQDPMTTTSGFYRSLAVGTFGVTTDEVVSAGYGDTSLNPTSLLIPGNASVTTDGANLYGSPDNTTGGTPLPSGTRLHVVDQMNQTTAVGTALVEVQGIDDPSISGFMVASDLGPRDSTAPIVRALDPGTPFSPNGDGQVDQATIRGRFTEIVAWRLQVKSGASVLFEKTGSGATFEVAWDGMINGSPAPDGTYDVTVTGVDAWNNAPAQAARTLKVDTQAPTLAGLTPGAETAQWFAPNGDGFRDTVTVSATNPEPGAVLARVLDAGGNLVKKWSVANGSAAVPVTWDGRTTAGAFAPDGTYTIRVAPQDLAGNIGVGVDRTVSLIGALRSVASSRSLFFPQDLDALATSTTLSFALARPMTVTWTVRNAAGATVATQLAGVAVPAGTQTWKFSGRRSSDGGMLPRGHYAAYVTATDGTLTATQTVAFDLDAFRIKLSDSTPKRGQSITVTVTSAETLGSRPSLSITQPGVARWSVRMTKVSTYTYRITVRMKSSGRAGPVSFKVRGTDTKGGTNSTTTVFTIH